MALTDSLISHWKLNETSGARNDAHGANHLTDNNTVGYAAGLMGNAADFETGSSEYLSIADNADLSFADEDFAIAGWVNLESTGGYMALFSKGSADSLYLFFEYVLAITSTGAPKFSVASAGANTSVSWGSNLSTGTWYFLYAHHDSVNNQILLQVNNGAPVTASCSHGCKDGSAAFYLGAFSGGGGSYYDGLMDSVSVWNRCLTSDERTTLYNSGAGLDYENWVATGHPASKRMGGVQHAGRLIGNSAMRVW